MHITHHRPGIRWPPGVEQHVGLLGADVREHRGVTALAWAVDGTAWLPTPLVQHVVREATGEDIGPIRGTTWFRDGSGRSLADLADAVPGREGRDWSDLHAVLDAMPAGTWTTYGDLAQVVQTCAQALGRHLTTCDTCPGVHRVLGASGRVAPGFQWSDPDRTDRPQEVLASEGVVFHNGVATPEQHLGPERLAALVRANA